jgi:RDD family
VNADVNLLVRGRTASVSDNVPVAWGIAVVEQQSIAPVAEAPVAYARFTRRIQGLMIDNMIIIIGFIFAIFLAASTGLNGAARAIGLAAFGALLLYEPVLVSTRGGTIGHSLRNLRVVNDRTGGNIGFVAAFVRFVVKVLLGWISFIAMLTTQRHQAFHDVITHSTVQLRDIQFAEPHHFVQARSSLSTPGMPSRARRIAAIIAYGILSRILILIAFAVLLRGGLLSVGCLRTRSCSPFEMTWMIGLGVTQLTAIAWIIFLGWQGRLVGARSTKLA